KLRSISSCASTVRCSPISSRFAKPPSLPLRAPTSPCTRSPRFVATPGPTRSRENVQRKLVVMCNVSGRDLGSVVADIRDRMTKAVPFPQGYRVEYGGQFESASEATRTLLVASALAIVGVFLLLTAALRSARDALLVLINLPLAL